MPVGDFIMVIPPDWTEIPNATAVLDAYGRDAVLDNIALGDYGETTQALALAGILPEGQIVANARAVTIAENDVRLWVIYGPE